MSRNPFTFVLTAILAACLLAGCETTEGGAVKEIAKSPAIDIRKGSPTADLIAALGEPKSVHPAEGDPDVEIWTYQIERSTTQMVAYRSTETPYVDPITGEMKTILEPDYKPETIKTTETIQVFVAGDIVLGWKVDREEERDLIE